MTTESGRIIVELRAGNAEQTDVGLTPGEPIDAFSVGQNGSWRIQSPGVADVHAYMYFDGATFYLASVDIANPAWINGRPVPTDWQPVTPPCEIAMGSARFWVEVEEELDAEPDEPIDEARMAELRAIAARRDARPKRPRISPPKLDESTAISALRAPVPAPAQGLHVEKKRDKVKQIKIRQSAREAPPDEESTRLAPIDVVPAPEARSAPLPAAGRPAEPAPAHAAGSGAAAAPIPGGSPTLAGPPVPDGPPIPAGFTPPGVTAAPIPPQGYAGAPVPAAFPPAPSGPGSAATTTARPGKKRLAATIAESWKLASVPQKAILVLMPFAIAAMFVIFDDKDKAAGAPSASRQRPSASASSLPASTKPPPTPVAPPEPVPTPAPEPSASAPSVAETAATNAPAAAAKPRGKEPPKSEERMAADLVAAGNFAEAAAAYDNLAQKHPESKAFREAARILREKAARGSK
jgi:predicted component of type VI protein secretion system